MIDRSAALNSCRAVTQYTLATVLLNYVLIRTLCQWLGVDHEKQSYLFLLFSSLSAVASVSFAFFSRRLVIFSPSILSCLVWFYICHSFDLPLGDIQIAIAVFVASLLCMVLLSCMRTLVIAAVDIAGPWFILILLVNLGMFFWNVLTTSVLDIAWLLVVINTALLLLCFHRFALLTLLLLALGCGIWWLANNIKDVSEFLIIPSLPDLDLDSGVTLKTTAALGLILIPSILVIFIELLASYIFMTKGVDKASGSVINVLFLTNTLVTICVLPLMISPYQLAVEKAHRTRSYLFATTVTHIITAAMVTFALNGFWLDVADLAFALLAFTTVIIYLSIFSLKKRWVKKQLLVLILALATAIWFSINVSMTGWLPEAIELPLEYVPFTFLVFYIWLRYALSLR